MCVYQGDIVYVGLLRIFSESSHVGVNQEGLYRFHDG
jgi:hypothetical protein